MSSGDELLFVHCVPRRTRLKVPKRRGDKAFFANVERRLKALSGVVDVTVTPATAGIVVHHTPGFQWRSVRLDAMGLRPVVPARECTCTCLRCQEKRSGMPDPTSAAIWGLKALCSGQPVAHVAELVASTIIQSALDDLLKPDPAAL